MKQKNLNQYAYNQDDEEDDSYFEPARHPTRTKKSRGYEADSFIVPDAEDDEDFAPVRVAKPSKSAKSRGLGAPITVDQRTADLNDFQNDVLRDFMGGAKSLRKDIMSHKGYREAIFTDTVLREMGIDLPQNLDEMRAIHGIRHEMVDLWGKQFLPLIENTRVVYGDHAPVPRNPLLRRRQVQRPRVVHEVSDDDDGEEVVDQNHQLVVDLCSDDDAPVPAPIESESDYFFDDGDDFEEEDDDGAVHISHHFTQNQDPEVAHFNSRWSQLGPAIGDGSTAKPAKAPTSRAGSKAPGAANKKRPFRRNGSGSFGGKGYAGVKKRGPKAAGGRASGGATSTKRAAGGGGRRAGGAGGSTGGAGGGGWSSVMAMPT